MVEEAHWETQPSSLRESIPCPRQMGLQQLYLPVWAKSLKQLGRPNAPWQQAKCVEHAEWCPPGPPTWINAQKLEIASMLAVVQAAFHKCAQHRPARVVRNSSPAGPTSSTFTKPLAQRWSLAPASAPHLAGKQGCCSLDGAVLDQPAWAPAWPSPLVQLSTCAFGQGLSCQPQQQSPLPVQHPHHCSCCCAACAPEVGRCPPVLHAGQGLIEGPACCLWATAARGPPPQSVALAAGWTGGPLMYWADKGARTCGWAKSSLQGYMRACNQGQVALAAWPCCPCRHPHAFLKAD